MLVIPAHPFNQAGLDVPELFRTVLEDVSKSTEIGNLGYNIDVLTPQNFNEVMWSGFQEVLNGSKLRRAGPGITGGLGGGEEAGEAGGARVGRQMLLWLPRPQER